MGLELRKMDVKWIQRFLQNIYKPPAWIWPII